MPRFDKLLILDLDGSTIFSTPQPLSYYAPVVCDPYHMYKRPGLDYFLSVCASWFHCAVWTASSREYAQIVIWSLFPSRFPLDFVYHRDHCTLRPDGDYMKRLAKARRGHWELGQILLLDDTPNVYAENFGNGIPITSWEGDRADDALMRLLPHLERWGTIPNVREVEKRFWQSRSLGIEATA